MTKDNELIERLQMAEAYIRSGNRSSLHADAVADALAALAASPPKVESGVEAVALIVREAVCGNVSSTEAAREILLELAASPAPVESGVVEKVARALAEHVRPEDISEGTWWNIRGADFTAQAEVAIVALERVREPTEAMIEADERVPILQEGLRSALDMVEEAAQGGSYSVTEFGYLNSLCAAQVGG